MAPATLGRSPPLRLRLAHSEPVSSFQHLAAEHTARFVRDRSGGEVEVMVYPAGTLGTESQLVSFLREGSIDMCLSGTPNLCSLLPTMTLPELPFLFSDTTHARRAMDGSVGATLLQDLPSRGLQGLGWYENGWRCLSNSRRRVLSPDDARGLSVRSSPNPYHFTAFRLLGMNPAPMPLVKLYAALEHGEIDAQDHPVAMWWAARLYDVQPYLSLTMHAYSPLACIMNCGRFERLRPAHKRVVRDAIQEGCQLSRRLSHSNVPDVVRQAHSTAVSIEESIDSAAFREMLTEPLQKAFRDEHGNTLLEQALNA